MRISPQSRVILTAVLLISTLLTGCSPHPGTGIWNSTGENEAGISRITIRFDAKAEIFTSDEENAALGCIWSADSKNSLIMNCKESENQETAQRYHFVIDTNGNGKLLRSDNTLVAITKEEL